MFGDNQARKQDLDPRGTLAVSAIFPTIQGEGPFAGEPAIFVRLSGCNLRCIFCDTDFESVRVPMSVDGVLESIQKCRSHLAPIPLVVITGGEPFLQNIVPLIHALHDAGYAAQIETAGTVSIPAFPWGVAEVVVSPKTPKVHDDFTRHARHWKYILSADADQRLPGTWLPVAVAGKPCAAPPDGSGATVWLQPMDQYDEHKNRRNIALCAQLAMTHGHRVSLQTHKIMGVE